MQIHIDALSKLVVFIARLDVITNSIGKWTLECILPPGFESHSTCIRLYAMSLQVKNPVKRFLSSI